MHIKKSLAVVILAGCFFADGSIPGTQAYAGENQIAYCASPEDLDAIFNDAQLMESDTVQFQCSEAFLYALLEDGSILTKAEYGHNMVNASIQYDQSGWMELSDIEYGEIFCSQCSTQDDIANTFSSYVQGQDPEEVIALFLDEPLFREMMDGSRLEVLAFQAGMKNFDLKYSEQSCLFWMENITYEERAGEEAVLVSNEEEFHSLMDYYAAEGKTEFIVFFEPSYFDEITGRPEEAGRLLLSSLLDHFSWSVNSPEHYLMFSDVSWLVSEIPYAYVENGDDYAEAIDDFASRELTRFTILFEDTFFRSLMDNQDLLLSVQLSSRINTYESSVNETFSYIRYEHVDYADVPSYFCGSSGELVQYLQDISAKESESGPENSSYRISFPEPIYRQLMENECQGLYAAEEQAGLIGYDNLAYSDYSCTITYINPVFASGIVSLATLEEADAYFASMPKDADPVQVLHCTEELYQMLLTDEDQNTIDHSRVKRLDDILLSHGIFVSSYRMEEERHFIVLEGCSYYPGMKIVYAVNEGSTQFLSEREMQTMDAAVKFAEDARKQTVADGTGNAVADMTPQQQLQTAKYIHDRLCRGVKYEIDDSTDEDDTAIGALLNGEANCDGYADAFYLVGSLAGLTVAYQHGESADDADNYLKDETHAWNLLKLDDTWRLVDVTWDDSDQYGIEYTWFNIGLDRAERTHHWNHETGLPLAQETDLSARPDNEYTVYSPEEAVEAIDVATVLGFQDFSIFFVNEDDASHYEDVLNAFGGDGKGGWGYIWNPSMCVLRILNM